MRGRPGKASALWGRPGKGLVPPARQDAGARPGLSEDEEDSEESSGSDSEDDSEEHGAPPDG